MLQEILNKIKGKKPPVHNKDLEEGANYLIRADYLGVEIESFSGQYAYVKDKKSDYKSLFTGKKIPLGKGVMPKDWNFAVFGLDEVEIRPINASQQIFRLTGKLRDLKIKVDARYRNFRKIRRINFPLHKGTKEITWAGANSGAVAVSNEQIRVYEMVPEFHILGIDIGEKEVSSICLLKQQGDRYNEIWIYAPSPLLGTVGESEETIKGGGKEEISIEYNNIKMSLYDGYKSLRINDRSFSLLSVIRVPWDADVLPLGEKLDSSYFIEINLPPIYPIHKIGLARVGENQDDTYLN